MRSATRWPDDFRTQQTDYRFPRTGNPLMTAKIYYDTDADLSLLKGKTVAILGYGSQGHAQAQNLRDSGCKVIIGQRTGSPNYELAVSHGLQPVTVDETA